MLVILLVIPTKKQIRKKKCDCIRNHTNKLLEEFSKVLDIPWSWDWVPVQVGQAVGPNASDPHDLVWAFPVRSKLSV